MKLRTGSGWIVLVVSLVLCPVFSCLASDGVIIKVEGDIVVESNDKTIPASLGQTVGKGDTVRSNGGSASILYSDGRIMEVTKGSSLVVARGGTDDTLSNRLITAMSETFEEAKDPTIKATVRGAGNIKSVYPFNSCILPSRVKFEWEAMRGLAPLDISITAGKPEYRYYFRAKDSGTGLPKEAPALLPGTRYYWQIREIERVESEPYSSRICWFVILPEETEKELKAASDKIDTMKEHDVHTRALLKASLLISYKLHNDALALLEAELAKMPKDEATAALLTGLYSKMRKADDGPADKQ